MPRDIPIFVKNNYVTYCFSDDTMNTLYLILEQCKLTNNSKVNYITTDGRCTKLEFGNAQEINLLSQYDMNAVLVDCDLSFKLTDKKIDKTLDNDFLNGLKTQICSAFNQSESKNIHEMISYSSLILKVPINQTIDKQLLKVLWSTLNIDTNTESIKVIAMKKIVRHGKKEYHKEMKVPKKEYCQSNVDLFKSIFYKDELYKSFLPDKSKKEITHLYIYTNTDFVLMLEELKQEIYFLIKNKKHISLKHSFRAEPNNVQLWSNFIDIDILNVLKHYVSLNVKKEISLKHATINYDAFISVSDISLTLERQAWLKHFFCWPNSSESNYIHYRPHYQTKEIDINTDISAKIQQIDKKNCIRFMINVPENNTFSTVKDVIQVIYFLLDPEKLQHSSIGKLNYKEFDPYLFKDNIRKGGYTRQCTDYWDKKIVGFDGNRIKRKKVPRLLVSKGDYDAYDSIPNEHKKYKLYYRGNYYAAIDDYIANSDVIEKHNDNLDKGKKKELYLNTVVLFPIQDKYQKDNEELFYPECVRAKSGMPMPKHQYILKKLLDEGKIDIVGGNSDIIKAKLKTNQDLQRADLVYYISRIGTKLKGFSTFGTLPLVVNKFLSMTGNLTNSDYLSTFIRKVAINGDSGFLDACLDAVDDKYRKASIEEKGNCLSNYKKLISEWFLKNKCDIDWWISFGKQKRFSDNNLKEAELLYNDNLLKHTNSLDIIGMFFNVNIFVLELKNEHVMEKLNRTVLYDKNIPTLFILYWEGKGYEIVFKSNDQDSGKEIKKHQFLFQYYIQANDTDEMIAVKDNQPCDENDLLEYLSNVFEEHSDDASKLKYAREAIDKINTVFKQKVMSQFINNENKTVGLITTDGWMCPIEESPPIPYMAIQKSICKCYPHITVSKLSALSRVYPEFTIIKQILNHKNIVIGFLLKNDTICPIDESQFFKIDKPTINQKLIPYIEGITHFTVENIHKQGDARITYMNTLKKKKYYFELLLTEIHKIITDTSLDYKRIWLEIFDKSTLLTKLFDLLMHVTEKILTHQQDTNDYKFVNHPNEKITQNMAKRLIFQAFHYLKNHPDFIDSSIEIHMKKLNREFDDVIVIDNNLIKIGNKFESFF